MDRNPHIFATDTYEDITAELVNAAKSMEQGSIALAPGMHLHEALPAFQIGFEKVDTGNPANFKTLNAEIAAAKADFPIAVSESNICDFADALSCAEMGWHAGFSPVQTVSSCLAVEEMLNKLHESPGEVLASLSNDDDLGLDFISRVFILSVITSVGVAIELANISAVVYPEEDLHTTRPWYYLIDQIGGLQMVSEKLDKCYKLANSRGYSQLLPRIVLRQAWINVLKQKIPKKTVHLDTLVDCINKVFPEQRTESEQPSQKSIRSWFTVGCQSRLDMECLRLDLEHFSVKKTRELWLRIVQGIRACVPVFSIERSVDLLGFFLQFSLREEPAIVCAMLRTQIILPGQVLSQGLKQWVTKDICETAPPFDQRLLKTKDTERFLAQAALCYSDLLILFCQNRCRLREGLGMLFGAFDGLQYSAAVHREDKVSTLLASWVFFRRLQIMMWITLLSFETDIISYREAGYTNWYGFKLAQQLLTHLGRMRQLFEVHGQNARESPGYGFLAALELESQVLSQLLAAQYMLYIALHKGVSPPKPLADGGPTEEMLFKLRFQMFPSEGLPTLDDYKREFEAIDVETALRGSANASRSASGLLNSFGPLAAENPEIPKLKKSAVGLSVAVTRIIRGYEYAGGLETEGYHAYFPIPELTKQ